ncbi:MAG TPA: hypothetical protein VEF72_33100 [Mycobacterium sp.]|nr:hypothetical protein [Mycobacterium sp.]
MRSGDAPKRRPVNDSSAMDPMHQGIAAGRICSRVTSDDGTLRQLAAFVGMSVEAFLAAPSGGQTFTLPQLARLATVLGIDLDWRVTGTGLPDQRVTPARSVNLRPLASDRAPVGIAVERARAGVASAHRGVPLKERSRG